jgi:hypothetical protein
MALREYNRKRDFQETAEPAGKAVKKLGDLFAPVLALKQKLLAIQKLADNNTYSS